MESRFSIGSNAISSRPNMTTRALSAFVRNRSNKNATEYLTEVKIEDVVCGWKQGDALPELSSENLRKINEAARREVKRCRSIETDWERLKPEALSLKSAMKGKHTCDFLSGFARQVQQANARVQDPDSDSDSDLPLMQQRVLVNPVTNNVVVDPTENTDTNLELTLNAIQMSPAKKRTWRRDEAIIEYDEWGQKIPDANPLAMRNADFVYTGERGEIVELKGKLAKPPKFTTAAIHHKHKDLSGFVFFRHMRVYDEDGVAHDFDVSCPGKTACMLRYGTHEEGEDKLQQADLLSIYIPPKSNLNPIEIPHIEHGYLWDWDDLVDDTECASFVRGCTVPLKDNEVVNSREIYNSPAEYVEFPIRLFRSETELTGAKDEFFWTRAIDLSSGKECSIADIRKPLS
jgi:hypothetical protein